MRKGMRRLLTAALAAGLIVALVELNEGREALAARRERAEEGEGLRLRTGSGWVYVVPLARRPALRILAEGPDLELAAELCDFYAARAAELDRAQKSLSEREKEV